MDKINNKVKVSILAAALIVAGAGSSVYAFGFGEDFFTEKQKAVFEKLHELRASGEIEEADAYAEEVGLKRAFGEMRGPIGEGRHRGPGMMNGEFKADREAIQTAIENNDYEAFKALTSDRPFGPEITEENFAQMVEMHDLMQSGDIEGASLIREELGLRGGKGERGERGGFMGKPPVQEQE